MSTQLQIDLPHLFEFGQWCAFQTECGHGAQILGRLISQFRFDGTECAEILPAEIRCASIVCSHADRSTMVRSEGGDSPFRSNQQLRISGAVVVESECRLCSDGRKG